MFSRWNKEAEDLLNNLTGIWLTLPYHTANVHLCFCISIYTIKEEQVLMKPVNVFGVVRMQICKLCEKNKNES